MSDGIQGTPWYVRVGMILISQVALMGTQYLLFLQQAGVTATLGIAALQVVTAIAGSFGPGAAGQLARNVGKAISRGKVPADPSVPPQKD